MKVHFNGPRRGQKMTCGKGVACPFDHASPELRAARASAGIQQKRLQFAPSLRTEADILAVFPSIEWRFADVYTYGGLSPVDMDLLEVCLDRSPELGIVALEGGLQIATADFMDSRFLPEMEVRPLLVLRASPRFADDDKETGIPEILAKDQKPENDYKKTQKTQKTKKDTKDQNPIK
ncbi:hypothetical protein EBU02_12035 [bacterium]|nr:hypothetical protein [bacterium]